MHPTCRRERRISMSLIPLLAVGAGGAIGALSRYAIYSIFEKLDALPSFISTLSVNIVGSLILGIISAFILYTDNINENLQFFLMVGILSSLTTFSTFAMDSVKLIERQAYIEAALYILGSIIFSISAYLIANFLTRYALNI